MNKYYNKEIECLDRKSLKKLQSERLVALIEKVYNTVEPYRKKMDEAHIKPSDIKSIEDIVKLPFTVKHDLRENYPFGMFSSPKKDIVRVHASSGTTGKLTVVGYTKRDLDDWATACARSLVSCGASEESIVHVAYGYGLFTGGLGLHYGSEKLGCMTVPASSGGTLRQLMLMKDFKADVLCCTPSYAEYLAEEIEKNNMNIDEFSLKIGIFGAEPWTEEMRKDIEKRLKIKAYNIYGLSEISGPGVSIECEYQNGGHIQEDLFYPEIINPETLEPMKEGEEGELVITTLNKEGMPLIRYRTRDITSLNYEKCKCGRTTVRMNRIYGRSDDMLIIRGVNVFPSQIESVLLNVRGILPQYQIVADRKGSLDTIEILVEISEEFFSDEVKKIEQLKKEIEENMSSMLSISPKITLVSPNSLPRSEGKAVRVIDKRNIRDKI